MDNPFNPSRSVSFAVDLVDKFDFWRPRVDFFEIDGKVGFVGGVAGPRDRTELTRKGRIKHGTAV
jgi:hypothetical protein